MSLPAKWPSGRLNVEPALGSSRGADEGLVRACDNVKDAAALATDYNHMNVLSMHALIGAYKPEGY